MRILWCQEHGQNGYEAECYFYRQCQPARGDCRMVPMRLIPDNAETLISSGIRAWMRDPSEQVVLQGTKWILAALDGETP